MRATPVGGVLLLLAVVLVGGLVLPGRLRAGAIRGETELARASARRAESQARSSLGARRASAQPTGLTPSEKLRRVRRALLEALEGLPLEDVRMEVREAQLPDSGVAVRLAAQGRFVTLIDATTRLIEPRRGLVLASLRLTPRDEHARMELEAQCR